jgi:hypothetical protein
VAAFPATTQNNAWCDVVPLCCVMPCLTSPVALSVLLCWDCVQLKAQFPDSFKSPELNVPPKHTLAALGGAAQHKELHDRCGWEGGGLGYGLGGHGRLGLCDC